MALTAQQLAEHNAALGGSDAAAYAGQDPFKTTVDLYREKIGEAARVSEKDPRIEWGARLEPVVRRWLAEQIGHPVLEAKESYHHPQFDFLVAHLDGLVLNTQPAEGVEIKCADKFLAEEFGEVGSDQVPIRHVYQVTHYMAVTGIRRFHLGVLIGGNDSRRYVIDYDPTLADMLVARARAFWKCVETRVPPVARSLADADYLWPRSDEHRLKASEKILEALTHLTRLRGEERRASREADEYELQIKAYMGNSAILADPNNGRRLLTWRQQEREYFDVKALARDHADLVAQYRTTSTFRVFRLR